MLNKRKTKIISDRNELKEVGTVGGVEMVSELKYLGMSILCG